MLHCGLLSPALLLIFFRLRNLIVTFIFEKLDVYQKAVEFADQAALLTEGFPRRLSFAFSLAMSPLY